MTLKLKQTLAAWDQPNFKQVFCQEVAALPYGCLPLQQHMVHGSYLVDRSPTVLCLAVDANSTDLKITAGIFFHSLIAGCNCSDDPEPPDEQTEHVELLFFINRNTGITRIGLSNSAA